MAELVDNYVLQVLLLTLCFLEINSINSNTTKVNLITNNTVLTTVKQLQKTTINETINHNTHNGREHVVMTSAPNFKQTTSKNSKILVTIKPDSKKKDSSVNESIKIVSTTSKVNVSTTIKPVKPIRTVHDDLVDSLKPQVSDPAINRIDISMDKKIHRTEYIVPIVAVILSVPLVAVLISLLYKKGKDWWQHRNYRRMDYLIEGMYNS